jgi:putative protease
MKQIELLAPAKDLECSIAAIKCGADAVYIGAEKFGARAEAGNRLRDIEKLIEFAHKFNVKVYVTVNTILNDDEILQAQCLINTLYEIGVDAVIIQDVGLLELDLPPIPLIASTQMHNNTWQKMKFLEKVGFKRAILAREMSIDEIKEIRAKTSKIELEFFIHGALCVSYSGQCYMSYAIGGRSGNRGVCAQPCRKLYSLSDSAGNVLIENKYLLCLKDLNLSAYIKELIDAGITSFKIEGRLKDVNYVKNVVAFYRQKIDEVLDELNRTAKREELRKSSSGKSIIDFTPDLYKTFNRGYTDYFINGRKKDITSFDTPKSTGERIGKIISFDGESFTVDGKTKLNNGDGICFFDEKGELVGTSVSKVGNNRVYPNDVSAIRRNVTIYRNFDHKFIKKLKSDNIARKIRVKLKFSDENDDIVLYAIDEDGIEVRNRMKIGKELRLAKNKELMLDTIKKQISKLGDTDFEASEIEIELRSVYFIPLKTLNDFRRETIEQLEQKRISEYIREAIAIEKNNFPYPEKELAYLGNVLNEFAEKFYKRHGVEQIEPAAESGIDMSGKKVMTTKYCLKYQLGLCKNYNQSNIDKMNSVREPFYLTDEQGKNYLLNFDCKNCVMEVIF